MDSVSEAIVDAVREWNCQDKEICFTDIVRMNIAAPPTIQKKIQELIVSGDLLDVPSQTPHGTKKLLFVPEKYATAEGLLRIRQTGMMIFQLKRIADNLEMLTVERSSTEMPRRKDVKGDGKHQTKLWFPSEGEK